MERFWTGYCISCGKALRLGTFETSRKEEPNSSEVNEVDDGVVCGSQGNYGSRVFDSDRGSIEFAVCDECLVAKAHQISYIQRRQQVVVVDRRPFTELLEPKPAPTSAAALTEEERAVYVGSALRESKALLNYVSEQMFEGAPVLPLASLIWEVCRRIRSLDCGPYPETFWKEVDASKIAAELSNLYARLVAKWDEMTVPPFSKELATRQIKWWAEKADNFSQKHLRYESNPDKVVVPEEYQ